MSVCVCVRARVCVYERMDGWMDVCRHTCMYGCMRVRSVCICKHACIHQCQHPYMQVCLHMHACIHASRMFVRVHAIIYVCMHACASMHIHISMFFDVCVHVCMCACVHVCMCVCVCVCVWWHTKVPVSTQLLIRAVVNAEVAVHELVHHLCSLKVFVCIHI